MSQIKMYSLNRNTMTDPEDSHAEGYQIPVEGYTKQDNQKSSAEIIRGARQDDQLNSQTTWRFAECG
jgi:hypothetical protein